MLLTFLRAPLETRRCGASSDALALRIQASMTKRKEGDLKTRQIFVFV